MSGTEAQFSVGAEGENLSYQWQTKASDASEWENASVPGAQTDTITVQATEELNGQQYRCVVMCEEESVTTEAATLTVVKPDFGQLPFLDVCSGDWFYDAVRYVVANGFMNGTSSTLFASNGTMTRAMLVTVLYRMACSPSVRGLDMPFTDVRQGWYHDAVLWAYSTGIVNGVSSTEFAPENLITREQMVTIFWRYMNHLGLDVSAPTDLNAFPDCGSVSEYARQAFAWAVKAGIINGVGEGGASYLRPQGSATRAQAAAMIQRFDAWRTR